MVYSKSTSNSVKKDHRLHRSQPMRNYLIWRWLSLQHGRSLLQNGSCCVFVMSAGTERRRLLPTRAYPWWAGRGSLPRRRALAGSSTNGIRLGALQARLPGGAVEVGSEDLYSAKGTTGTAHLRCSFPSFPLAT